MWNITGQIRKREAFVAGRSVANREHTSSVFFTVNLLGNYRRCGRQNQCVIG